MAKAALPYIIVVTVLALIAGAGLCPSVRANDFAFGQMDSIMLPKI